MLSVSEWEGKKSMRAKGKARIKKEKSLRKEEAIYCTVRWSMGHVSGEGGAKSNSKEKPKGL